MHSKGTHLCTSNPHLQSGWFIAPFKLLRDLPYHATRHQSTTIRHDHFTGHFPPPFRGATADYHL